MAKIIGDFPNRATDWVNGEELNGTKMNEIDRALYLVDQNALNDRTYESTKDRNKWWAVNQKNLFKGETLTAGSDCSQSTDLTNTCLYNSSSRITVSSTLGDVFIKGYINKSPSANLGYFESGDIINTSIDRCIVSFYVSDATKVKSNSFNIFIGSAGGIYYKTLTVSTGWNVFTIKLSEFSSSGSPSWTAVTYYEFQWRTPVGVNAQNTYISFQYMGLIRGNTATTYNLTSQNNGEGVYSTDLTENVQLVSIFEDFFSYPIMYSLKFTSTTWLYISPKKWRCFYLKSSLVCKTAGALGGFSWRIDSNNRVDVYVQSNTLYMRLYASGTEVLTESNSNVLPYSIIKDDIVEFRFRKVNGYFECGIVCNGKMEEFVQLGYSSWADSEGNVIWGSFTTITDFTGMIGWELSSNNKALVNNEIKLRNDYVKLVRTTDQTISGTGAVVVQWNSKTLQGGNRLTFDSANYAIKVGKGVKAIHVNLRCWADALSGGRSWMDVTRNGYSFITDIIGRYGDTWAVHNCTAIIDVVENDLIGATIAFSVSASNLVRGIGSYAGCCELSAKVIEYN